MSKSGKIIKVCCNICNIYFDYYAYIDYSSTNLAGNRSRTLLSIMLGHMELVAGVLYYTLINTT